MTATIHPFPGTGPVPTADGAAAAGRPRPAALRWGLESATAIIQRMLDSADDSLFGLAEKTSSDQERKGFFDSMRLLRRRGPAILDEFAAGLLPRSQRSVSPPVQPATLALLDDQALEEDISVARVVGRIEGSADHALWEYAQRLDGLPAEAGLRDAFELLRPPALALAFRDALKAADVTGPTKLILFKLYERQFLADARPFYQGLNQRMEAEGYVARAVARPGGNGAPPPPTAPESAFPRGAASYSLPQSLRALLSADDGSTGGIAGGIAGGGAGLMPGMLSSLPAVLGSEGGVQRTALVSQLLDEIGRDWQPAELEALRRLVLPLVRIAVADASFFGDAQHPARALIAGLGAGATPDQPRDRRIHDIGEALQAMQRDAPAPERLQPLAPDQLLQFLGELRAPRDSTEARVARARDAAHRQIKAIGSGRDLPEGIASFLTEIWLPMVAAVNLRFGVDSEQWTTTNKLLERLFAQCRWLPGNEDPALIEDILGDVDSSLQAMAVPPKLIDKARSMLKEGLGAAQGSKRLLDLDSFRARKAVDAGAATPRAAAGGRLPICPGGSEDWRAAVPVSAWFRVYDRAADRTLWLTAEVLYPQASGLSFVGFDPNVRLTVDRADFLDDLAAAKADPVYPTDVQRAAIARLCAELAAARKGQSAR